ncbi:MAG: hypothetical protein AAGJ37_07565 [Pseudomonadota bacterium]
MTKHQYFSKRAIVAENLILYIAERYYLDEFDLTPVQVDVNK